MNRDVETLLGAYALDAVDDIERAKIELFLREHPEKQADVDSLKATAAELAAVDTATGRPLDREPPKSLRARVLGDAAAAPAPRSDAALRRARERSEDEADRSAAAPGTGAVSRGPAPGQAPPVQLAAPRARHRKGRGRLVWWGAGLAAAAAIALVAIVWSPWQDQPLGPPDGTQTTDQSGQHVAMEVMRAPDAKSYRFETLPATVVRSDSMGKAVLSVDATMPPAPLGKAYQIWWKNAQGSFASAGMMPVEHDGPVLLTGDAAAAVGVGVTVEPATGSPQPTTPPLGLVTLV